MRINFVEHVFIKLLHKAYLKGAVKPCGSKTWFESFIIDDGIAELYFDYNNKSSGIVTMPLTRELYIITKEIQEHEKKCLTL